jgi:hypothetical protein
MRTLEGSFLSLLVMGSTTTRSAGDVLNASAERIRAGRAPPARGP